MFKTITGYFIGFLIGCVFFTACTVYLHNRVVVNHVRHALGTCEKAWQMDCTMIAVPTSLIHALDHLNSNAPAASSTVDSNPEAMTL